MVLAIPSTILSLDFRTSALDYHFIRFEERVKGKREVRIDDLLSPVCEYSRVSMKVGKRDRQDLGGE